MECDGGRHTKINTMNVINEWGIDNSWSIFLDRDGVINRKLDNDYVKNIDELELLPGATASIKWLSHSFQRVFIATNQQCVGKGIITNEQLEVIHSYLLQQIQSTGGYIDQIYCAPYLDSENHIMRKPNPGMALKAKEDFPEIDLEKSIMIGDAKSDIEMGKRAGMKTIFIGLQPLQDADAHFLSLQDLVNELKEIIAH